MADSEQTTSYSHDAAVAAITSYLEFLSGVHSEEVGKLKYPPPSGWPQITRASFASMGKTNAVIDLLRYIPYFEQNPSPCILDVSTQKMYIDHQICEFIASGKVKTKEEWEESSETQKFFRDIIFLTDFQRDGYDLLLDTKRGTVTCWKIDNAFPDAIQDAADAPSYGEVLELDEEVDEYGDDAWKVMPTFKIETFFEMCKNEFRRCHWMPKLEELGRGGISQRDGTPEEGDDLKRMQILRDNGWPGDGQGGGWNKKEAEKETQQWRDGLPY